jgi:phenylpropionate dioxygenase-like ring-hydroxylating dioxygenase large terminal subunit
MMASASPYPAGYSASSTTVRPTERNYPFNCWWMAGTSEEVTRKPLARSLLRHRLVLFRTEAGSIAALEDRCAHRWAPLSHGRLFGDDIECPYHGFRYAAHGACTRVPTQVHVPAALKVKSYPVRELGDAVWVWMGDPEKADPALLPHVPWLTDPSYVRVRWYGEIKCNYMLIHDNILDLTHIAYLHGDVGLKGWERARPEVTVSNRTVTYRLAVSGVPLFPLQAVGSDVAAGKKVNRNDWGTFATPACHLNGFDIEDPAPEPNKRRIYHSRGMLCPTPISAGRSHFWVVHAQNYGHELPDLPQKIATTLRQVLKQDQDMLEAIQAAIDGEVGGENVPMVLVAADRAPGEARRILQEMLAAEI